MSDYSWMALFEEQGGMSPDQFNEIAHLNGTTAWNAALLAALGLEVTGAEVVTGWEGINPDEVRRTMLNTVRRAISKLYDAAGDESRDDTADEINSRRAVINALDAVRCDDGFALAAAFALPVASANLTGRTAW